MLSGRTLAHLQAGTAVLAQHRQYLARLSLTEVVAAVERTLVLLPGLVVLAGVEREACRVSPLRGLQIVAAAVVGLGKQHQMRALLAVQA
jgi:hypothetical protein